MIVIQVLPAFCQKLQINEIMTYADRDATLPTLKYPWVEIRNSSTDTVSLSTYSISFDSITFISLPDCRIFPKQYLLITFSEEVPIHDCHYQVNPYLTATINHTINRYTEVVYFAGEEQVSKIVIPSGIRRSESYGRYPTGSEDFVFYPESLTTPGTFNKYPGPWQKVQPSATFKPRDSTPNGVLVYNNKVWLFEGYKLMEPGTYYSTSDLHNSDDGVRWQMINPEPPYNPYSAFIVFQDWMWAFEYRAYRSQDGVNWEDMGPTPLSLGGRIALHDGKLFWTSGRDIYTSEDGISWTLLVADGPWEIRAWPGFLSMNGKLWLFGGAGAWNTTSPYYYRDVWSSTDGLNWKEEIREADFPGRYWFGANVFDNKLWILGGYNYYDDLNGDLHRGNKNDIWYSADGVKWEQLMAPTWTHRHAPLSWVLGDNLFVSSGANGYYLLNDVWRFEKEQLDGEEILSQVGRPIYGDIISAPKTFSRDLLKFTPEKSFLASLIANDSIQFTGAGPSVMTFHAESTLLHHGGDVTFPLNVRKKDLIVQALDTAFDFGEPVPDFALRYDGFVRNDDPSDLEELPFGYTDASMFAPIGTYRIAVSTPASANYNIVGRPGVLKIEGKDQLVVFPIPASSVINLIYSNYDIRISSLRLFSSTGDLVLHTHADRYHTQLDVSTLPAGLYTLFTSFTNSTSPVLTRVIVSR